MKVVHYCDHEQFARIREGVLKDEMDGYDPGAYWARIYPGATEVEFVVGPPSPQDASR